MAYFFLFRLPNAEITVPAEPAVPLVARDICKDDWIICDIIQKDSFLTTKGAVVRSPTPWMSHLLFLCAAF